MSRSQALALLTLAGSLLPASAQTDSRTFTLKVFLAEFSDIPAPAGYTREYVHDLFFGLGGPRQTPEGRGVGCSVREYFLDLSQGRIDLDGEVSEWIQIPREITRIPHWKSGMEPFGESWPVIVAETLRGAGVVGEQAAERVKLSDGRRPDLLVFLNTDWGVGGVNRGWGHLRDVLGRMELGDLWDEAWTGLPQPFSSFSITIWRGAPGSGRDGTIDQVPTAEQLELFPMSIVMHEMGHQLAGWPDLYGGAYEPWGVQDLMGGPAASTHYPMSVSAFLRAGSGWMDYTEPPRRSAQFELMPLETHREALRLRQGPGQERLILENRAALRYAGDYGTPPANDGPRLLVYREDPGARRRQMYGDRPVGKRTQLIRRGGRLGELWGGEGATELTGASRPSSRNALGELWWEFRGITPTVRGSVRFDAEFAAADLVRDFGAAAWNLPEVGRYGAAGGHVALIRVDRGETGQALHLVAPPGEPLHGSYAAGPGPRRLYLTAAGSGSLAVGGTLLELGEQPRTMAVELPGGELELVLSPGGSATIDEAWLVGLPPVLWSVVNQTEPIELADGVTYGPDVWRATAGGEQPEETRYEWPLTPPEGGLVRALLGLTGATPAGARVTARLTLADADHAWPLLGDLELRRSNGRDAAVIVEEPVPAAAVGADCRLILRLTPIGELAAEVAVPVLMVTE